MAGPFHYDLGRYATGEGEADEGSAAGVGSYKGVFGVGFFYALSGSVADFGDWGVEAAEFAEVFEVFVHFLVGYDGEGKAGAEGFFVVFVENLFGKFVQVYGEAVIGFLGGYVEGVSVYIGGFYLGHVGVAEGCEGAEAEEVSGFGEGSGFLYGLFVFKAIHVCEFYFGSVEWDLVGV